MHYPTDPRPVDVLKAAAQAARDPAEHLKVKAGELRSLLDHVERLETEVRTLRAAAVFTTDAA